MSIGWGVSDFWGSKNRGVPLTRLVALTTVLHYRADCDHCVPLAAGASTDTIQGRCYRLLLYPWHWPCILQARLHAVRLVADVTGRAHFRSAERRDMLFPRTRTELGQRSFQVAAPTVWNSLPAHLRSTLISRRQFRDGLKSHLVTEAYFWSSENICFKSVIYVLTYLLRIHHSVFARRRLIRNHPSGMM